jgi:predicted RNA methylase
VGDPDTDDDGAAALGAGAFGAGAGRLDVAAGVLGARAVATSESDVHAPATSAAPMAIIPRLERRSMGGR